MGLLRYHHIAPHSAEIRRKNKQVITSVEKWLADNTLDDILAVTTFGIPAQHMLDFSDQEFMLWISSNKQCMFNWHGDPVAQASQFCGLISNTKEWTDCGVKIDLKREARIVSVRDLYKYSGVNTGFNLRGCMQHRCEAVLMYVYTYELQRAPGGN